MDETREEGEEDERRFEDFHLIMAILSCWGTYILRTWQRYSPFFERKEGDEW